MWDCVQLNDYKLCAIEYEFLFIKKLKIEINHVLYNQYVY